MKIFLFDVDGVVINSAGWSKDVFADWAITSEQLQEFFRSDFEDCICGRRDLEEALEPWLSGWGHKNRTRDFMQYWFEKDSQVNSSVLNLVRNLLPREVCFLATNQDRHRSQFLMESLDFNSTFAGIFAAWELGCAKPNPDFFLQISDRLGARFGARGNALEIHFIDDLEKNVAAAAALGWHAHRFEDFPPFEAWLNARVSVTMR